MQTNSKTVAKKPRFAAQPSRSETLTQARAAVAEALKAHPALSASQLSALLKSFEGRYVPALTEMLLGDFYEHGIRSLRRQQTMTAVSQLKLPGFEHLPAAIPGPKNKPIPLAKATYTCVRAYYRSLSTAYDARKDNDPRIKEAKALMELMRRRTGRDKRITVREVVLIDA